MSGRIETYLHSDKSTPHKGGAMVRVLSQTDFGSRSEEFISFCRLAARFAYASSARGWYDLIDAYPDMETSRTTLEKALKEKVSVEDIVILNV